MLFFVALCIVGVTGLDNGLALTPPMGFNTWDSFRCDFDEQDVLKTIDAIYHSGLHKLGWKYFNLDDW